MFEVKEAIDKNKTTCQELVFKGDVQFYVGKRREIIQKIRLIPMNKLSCKGCDNCFGSVSGGRLYEEMLEGGIQGFEKVEEGKLYKIECIVDGTDWETGYVDDWHLEIVEYKLPIKV